MDRHYFYCGASLFMPPLRARNNLCLQFMFWSLTSGKDVTVEKSGILVTFDTPLIEEYMDKQSYTDDATASQ